MRRSPVRSVNVPVAGTALFLIDVINDLDFKDSGALVAQAEPMAVRLSVLKRRAAAAGVPCVYINDNFLAEEIPQLLVPLDPDWRLPWDRHPNARAAGVIAAAVAARLHPH
jgi:nicotinamidase-related amidase